jgi:hypothetical protein
MSHQFTIYQYHNGRNSKGKESEIIISNVAGKQPQNGKLMLAFFELAYPASKIRTPAWKFTQLVYCSNRQCGHSATHQTFKHQQEHQQNDEL